MWYIYRINEHFLPHVLGFHGFCKFRRAVTFHKMGILKNGFHHWKEQSESNICMHRMIFYVVYLLHTLAFFTSGAGFSWISQNLEGCNFSQNGNFEKWFSPLERAECV